MKLIGLVGNSGSGKTTLITQLLPLLRQQGLRVSTIKHAHHGFDLQSPAKTVSGTVAKAGAEEVMLVSDGRWALLHERRGDDDGDTSLHALAQRMTRWTFCWSGL